MSQILKRTYDFKFGISRRIPVKSVFFGEDIVRHWGILECYSVLECQNLAVGFLYHIL